MKGGLFALSLHWPDLALVALVVSVKSGTYTMRKKKLATVIVGLFTRKAPTKN